MDKVVFNAFVVILSYCKDLGIRRARELCTFLKSFNLRNLSYSTVNWSSQVWTVNDVGSNDVDEELRRRVAEAAVRCDSCLLYTSPSPRDS